MLENCTKLVFGNGANITGFAAKITKTHCRIGRAAAGSFGRFADFGVKCVGFIGLDQFHRAFIEILRH